jgi:hypothetical protein
MKQIQVKHNHFVSGCAHKKENPRTKYICRAAEHPEQNNPQWHQPFAYARVLTMPETHPTLRVSPAVLLFK